MVRREWIVPKKIGCDEKPAEAIHLEKTSDWWRRVAQSWRERMPWIPPFASREPVCKVHFEQRAHRRRDWRGAKACALGGSVQRDRR